jgi:N-acetylglucosaminyl-diphospho-decaprenol L-rhamnosyltransferase
LGQPVVFGTNQLRVAIIVVGYDGVEWFPPLLESLRKSVGANDHLVIVDNGGNGNTIPAVFPECQFTVLKAPRRMGFCDANNVALEQLPPCDLVCFLNQDVVVDKSWLSPVCSAFEASPQLGAVSPVHLTYDFRRINPNFRSTLRPGRRTIRRRLGTNNWFPCKNLIAAAMFVRLSVLEKVGGFDPIFGSYCEDYDLCRRIQTAGYQTGVVPDSRIGHFDGSATRTPAAIRKRERQTIRNWAILNIRRSPSRTPELLRQFLVQFPRRMAGALLRRPGSKHLMSVIRAYLTLLMLVPRLISPERDRKQAEKHWVKMKERMREVGVERRA